MLHIKLIKSVITQNPAQRKTVKALGFSKINQVRVHPDNDCVRGMVNKVKHLVEVEVK
jgi:large subunit ribosomal protein L30